MIFDLRLRPCDFRGLALTISFGFSPLLLSLLPHLQDTWTFFAQSHWTHSYRHSLHSTHSKSVTSQVWHSPLTASSTSTFSHPTLPAALIRTCGTAWRTTQARDPLLRSYACPLPRRRTRVPRRAPCRRTMSSTCPTRTLLAHSTATSAPTLPRVEGACTGMETQVTCSLPCLVRGSASAAQA